MLYGHNHKSKLFRNTKMEKCKENFQEFITSQLLALAKSKLSSANIK